MKNLNIKQEAVLWLMIVAPFIYLARIWGQLPDTIPIHFDINGAANGWGPRYMALILPGMGLVTYIITAAIPFLDPKSMSAEFLTGNFFKLRLILVFFMSALAVIILHGTIAGGNMLPYVSKLIFLLLAGTGNFMINLKPNWFVGIRTPWTLSNDEVWRKTHQVGGRLFFFGGIIGFILSFILSPPLSMTLLIVFSIASVLFAVGYSFWLFRQIKARGAESEQ